MDDFKKSEVGTFDEELQALIDYGHDCCARIDDKIHEQCLRIKKAHGTEVGSYATALGLKQERGEWATTYDVLGNERHKAVCELRKFEPMMGGRPTEEASKLIRCITGKSDSHVACANDLEETRDRLIHLLGGDMKYQSLSDLFGILKEDGDGMDAGRCGETSAGGGVPAADKRRADCDDNLPSEGVASITQGLRNYLEAYRPAETDTCMEVARIGTLGYQGIMERLDAIDAIHANLERAVKRLTAECKTQRNNFDQATSAREHWKNLYEQALEHTHDLERDYEVACHVNEKQEREYLEWCDATRRMQKEIDDLKAKNGDMWLKGYHECHEELMEGNATLAADLEKTGWMQLPKDSDDVPVRIGDMMEWPDTTTAEVVGVGDGTFFYVEDGEKVAEWARTHDKIHHQPESVEDTLREFARAWTEWQDGAPIMNPVESFAHKLRLAEGEDA